MKFLFTCGGTAGHINPALAVAGRLKEIMPNAEVLFIGAEDRMETDLVPRAGYEIKTVKITNISRGLKPKDFVHNAGTLKNIVFSLVEARKIIKEFNPDVAIGTGGYVCFPVLAAAASQGIPTLVHESNAVPGLTTKVLEGIVDKVMVGFEDSRNNYRKPERVVVTGTPVRGEFSKFEHDTAKKIVCGDCEKPLVLSIWGSLGAAKMNLIMTELIGKACNEDEIRIIHASGEAGFSKMKNNLELVCPNADSCGFELRPYIYDMPQLMAAADVVICRAGASTLAELTAVGKAAILVPSPNVTNNHQEKNARVLEKAEAAKLIIEQELTADKLYSEIIKLTADEYKLKQMSENMSELYLKDATDRICDLILELAKK